MEIDWITVSAQIVNFLILVWLLKRFLYQPVIRAMDRREQRIADRLKEAQAREQGANEQIQSYRDKTEALDHTREDILTQAREEAGQSKKQMLEVARAEVAETRKQWQQVVNEEKEEFLGNLRRQAAEAIQEISRRALTDLADAALEERVVHAFLERLRALDKDARKALVDASGPMRIASAFDLEAAARARLTRAIHEYLAEDVEVEYRRSPELLCGIELTRGGRQLSWNLAGYMDELSTRIEEAFKPTETAKERG